jgi:hypothetical protein
MRNRFRMVAALAAVACLAATAAFAAVKLHYFTAQCVNDTLVADFKVTGLGKQPAAQFTVAAEAEVIVTCVNRGGNRPPGLIRTFTGVSATGEFPVRNGQTTGRLVTAALDPADFQHLCPPGMASTEVDVEAFHNVRLIGPDGTVLANIGTVVCP